MRRQATIKQTIFRRKSKKKYPCDEKQKKTISNFQFFRISRSCITDANFDTYSEVTLECRAGPAGENYHLLQAASTAPAGRKLAEDLGITEGDLVLLGVFAPGGGGAGSGLCAYSLPYIDRLFDQNIQVNNLFIYR